VRDLAKGHRKNSCHARELSAGQAGIQEIAVSDSCLPTACRLAKNQSAKERSGQAEATLHS